MAIKSQLRVGYINYLNSYPLFAPLLKEREYTFIEGVPAELNGKLYRGEIDISPSSSFEYLQHWREYLVAPDLSISSQREVESVLLFTPIPMEETLPGKISITGESATSINLLKVLLAEYHDDTNIEYCQQFDIENHIRQGGAGLLIGDRALQAKREFTASQYCYDLGELWYRHTGLPFVFALWIIRRDVAQKSRDTLNGLLRRFQSVKGGLDANYSTLAEHSNICPWMEPEEKVAYWRKISYDLNAEQQKGVRLYAELLKKHQLLSDAPEIVFYDG